MYDVRARLLQKLDVGWILREADMGEAIVARGAAIAERLQCQRLHQHIRRRQRELIPTKHVKPVFSAEDPLYRRRRET